MTRARRQRTRSGDLSDLAWAMLTDQPLPERHSGGEEWLLRFGCYSAADLDSPDNLPGLWRQHGAGIVEEWAVERPGTRPRLWWRWSSPRDPADTSVPAWKRRGAFRERVGGAGTACVDMPHMRAMGDPGAFGIPIYWAWPAYCGGTEQRYAPNPADPPLFEAQAAFLIRHGLLLPGEKRRLTPGDMVPEDYRKARRDGAVDHAE